MAAPGAPLTVGHDGDACRSQVVALRVLEQAPAAGDGGLHLPMRVPIEPALLPLREAMRREVGGPSAATTR
jgi:hypothetical protein